MELTKEDIEFIEDCFTFYMENEERFVSYDEHMETSKRVKEIMDKISAI